MLSSGPLRVVIAVFFVATLAALVFYAGGSGWVTAAVVMSGAGTFVAMTMAPDPEPLKPSTDPISADAVESAVIDAIAEPVLLLVDNRVRAANATAMMLLGSHIVGEDVRLAVRHPAASARLAANADDGSVELRGIGGRDQQMELNVATIAPGKRIVHLIDRTARRAVEQARVDFVANASHELRTPLAAILGFIETLADNNAGGDATVRARFLDVMLKEARRMQRLIDDLISLSRIEAEKYVIPDQSVSIPRLVREVANELRDQQGDQPTPVIFDLDTDVANVTGEHAQLSQVVHNLLGNAIKYGRPGADVKISVKRDGQFVRLSVADKGDGIAAEHIPRLTERFYRVDAGRSRTMGGTGLGLAIVKHIVERHRARLEISSVISEGTVVSVVFPPSPQPGVMLKSSN